MGVGASLTEAASLPYWTTMPPFGFTLPSFPPSYPHVAPFPPLPAATLAPELPLQLPPLMGDPASGASQQQQMDQMQVCEGEENHTSVTCRVWKPGGVNKSSCNIPLLSTLHYSH